MWFIYYNSFAWGHIQTFCFISSSCPCDVWICVGGSNQIGSSDKRKIAQQPPGGAHPIGRTHLSEMILESYAPTIVGTSSTPCVGLSACHHGDTPAPNRNQIGQLTSRTIGIGSANLFVGLSGILLRRLSVHSNMLTRRRQEWRAQAKRQNTKTPTL